MKQTETRIKVSYRNVCRHILPPIFLGLFASWMEWNSFGNWDFSEFLWIIFVLLLGILIFFLLSRKIKAFYASWITLGILCWGVWRFIEWIFVSRTGWIISVIGFITVPLQEMLHVDLIELTLMALSTIMFLLSLAGAFWVYKNFNARWLRSGILFWITLLGISIFIGIGINQPNFKEYCFGINSFSSSLSCNIQNQLGILGTVWISIVVLLSAITIQLKNLETTGTIPNLWLIVLQPVLIAVLFNPTRFLGVILNNVLRFPETTNTFDLFLTKNMLFINLMPLLVCFIVIPIGLWYIKSQNLRFLWSLSASAALMFVILGLLFNSFIITDSIFSFSQTDKLLLGLQALQLWLPLIIVFLVVKTVDAKTDE